MIAHRNLIKDISRVLFWFPLRWCVNFLPFFVVYWIGGVLGCIDYFFSGQKRIKKMSRNISQAFEVDKKGLEGLVRNNLQNHCRNVLEFLKYPQLTIENIGDCVFFEGLEFLDKELAKGKGVILFTAHFGAKQLLQVALGLRNYKINQICYHMDGNDLTFIQKHVSQKQKQKIEEKIPAKFISANSFLRSTYNCLKKNEILVIAADGIGLPEHINKGYAPFSFFGKRVLFPSNIVHLAKRSGASIVPIFVIREKIKHKIVIEPPIEINQKSIESVYKEFVKLLEKHIRQYPSLWEFWEEFEEGNLIVTPGRKM